MATMSNVSSKYQDIISKSTQISRGSPAIYRLKPNKKEMGTLTMLTVGERHDNQSNKTILLVGETGTGKSTLINALFNHMIGVTWDDQVWFQIVEEEKRSQSESQTSDVIVYQIFGFEGIDLPFSLSIIDTPGYGDTRGIERDVIISERLLDLFRVDDGIREIDAVGLVLKASECRLSDRLQYAFNSVMSLFGKDLEKNIVALVTYSDGMTPQNALEALENAKIKCARNQKNEPHHFLFNNQQKKERTEDNELPLENAWKITQRGMKQLMTFMKKTPPQKLGKTVKVLNECIRLTACIQNLQDRIKDIELKQKEIQQIKEINFPVALTLQTSVKAVTMATISNISSKYKEIISKSTQISRGILAFQVKPNKKQMGTLTMLTVGERHDNQSNKTILLVGETGTGKSTLINALFNHMIGVTWDDEVWFNIVEEEKRSQSESQTSDVIVYQIFGFEGIDLPFSLSIIDTPGYGHTRGIERDAKISERLLDLFWLDDGIREINAVGLVMKASECRLSDRLQYAFNSMMSLFGKDLEKNIVALLTYSDGKTPQNALKALENAKIQCARNKKNQPHHFLFNNKQKEERTEENELALGCAWKITHRGMKQLMTFMKDTPPQKLYKTVNVLNERIRLTACIQNLQERIEYTELKQKEIQQIKEAVNEKEVEVDEPYKVKENVSGGRRWFGSEKTKNFNLLKGLEADERKNMEEKKRLLDEAYEHVMSLKKLALSINAVSTFIPYDFLIEKMRERGDEAKAKELEEMKSQAEQENKSAAGNFGAKLMGMFK